MVVRPHTIDKGYLEVRGRKNKNYPMPRPEEMLDILAFSGKRSCTVPFSAALSG